MSKNIISIEDSRYSRLELIPWWEQKILKSSKVLVIGCGALGNEIIKNLTMLGFGNIFVVDMDKVEKTNLTRSVLFRNSDEGKFKAETAAKRARQINNDIKIKFFNGNVFNLGLGIFKEMDIVLCGLDNREARLFVNQSCWKVNIPWIDGAIESLSGVARMFIPPNGVCYECTMTENDFKLLNKRKSCMLLGIDEISAGKIPTTPTISSIIAGIQVQEAVKYLHKRKDLSLLIGKGFVFNGVTNDSYIVEYQRKTDCMSHYTFGKIIQTDLNFHKTKLEALFLKAKSLLKSNKIKLHLNNEIVYSLISESGNQIPFFGNMNLLSGKDIIAKGKLMKPLTLNTIEYFDKQYEFLKNKYLNKLGIPENEIFRFTSDKKEVFISCIPENIFKYIK